MVQFHPNVTETYPRKVAELELVLKDKAITAEAAKILRHCRRGRGRCLHLRAGYIQGHSHPD
jgi:hypothetical protein